MNAQFAETSPEYPTFSVLVTESNRKGLIANALRTLAGGTRTKDAIAILDALEMLDGDSIQPSRSRYAQEVLARLKAKGRGQVLNRNELLSGANDVEYFAPIRFRLEPDLLVTVLSSLVYAGDIVLAITGDKIDSGKLALLAERPLDDLKQFKHVEAPKEINAAVLRSLFEFFGLPTGLAQKTAAGDAEPVVKLQDAVSVLVQRVLKAGTDLQGRLAFWGKPLLSDEEAKDWRTRLEALKAFTESLSPFNTVGKLKNLRVSQEDIDTQKKNLDVLASVEALLDLIVELGATASYLSQAEIVLPTNHPWVKQAQTAQTEVLAKLVQDRTAQHAAEYKKSLAKLKKDYINAYIASHTKARLGVSEEKTKTGLRKDSRLVAMRALAGIALMPTSDLTGFEEKLDNLKSCSSLVETNLATSAFCPHCNFRPANEQLGLIPAATQLQQLDGELDVLIDGWQQTLLDNLADPTTQANLDLLKVPARKLIGSFLTSKDLPSPVTPDFVSAVQEALSGLEKIGIKSDELKQALLQGGSPAKPDELRSRFDTFLNNRCKGKDSTKLRFVIE
jgi:hypothetical protein